MTTSKDSSVGKAIVEAGSFRDPAGHLFRRDGTLLRQINRCAKDDYERLMGSGLYTDLVEAGHLVPHEEVDRAARTSDLCYKVIRPREIEFISYPYEWCFSQLKDAALLTLEIQRRALAHGLSLKDASAYNIQFCSGRPLLIDTLSLELYSEGSPWGAYRQFCQHFLAPLALMAYRDPRLGRLLQLHLDGVPLDLASELLPARSKLRPSLGVHIHLHARSQTRFADVTVGSSKQIGGFSKKAFSGWLDSLERAVGKLDYQPEGTEWIAYYEANHNYGASGLQHKERLLTSFLEAIRPETVWDLGANTGRFSRIACIAGAETISFDIDPACVEANYRMARRRGEDRILPLLIDLTNPSPAIGWAGSERKSLEERGPAECALALGLVHHLAISNNLPLIRVAQYVARLSEHLVIEFVPKDDSQVRKLLSNRDDIFDGYHQDAFEEAFSRVFKIERREQIPTTQRHLYLLRRRSEPVSAT